MFWFAAIFAVAFAVLHASRTGAVFHQQRPAELLANLAVSVTLIFLAVGIIERARLDDPFLWFHWPIVASLIAGTFAYGYLVFHDRRDQRRVTRVLNRTATEIGQWLAEVEHFEPCHNPDCERVRDEMRVLAQQFKTA